LPTMPAPMTTHFALLGNLPLIAFPRLFLCVGG